MLCNINKQVLLILNIFPESVLQKFRKTFSLRFQKKGSKESCSSDYADGFIDQSEEDSPQHVPTAPPEPIAAQKEAESSEQKYR